MYQGCYRAVALAREVRRVSDFERRVEDGTPASGPGNEPGKVSRVSGLVRSQIMRAFDWPPRLTGQAANPVDYAQDAALDRRSFLKTLSDRYGYPVIDESEQGSRFSQELVVGRDPFGEAAEAIRSIRSEVATSALSQGKRSLVLVGPRSQVGTTYLVSNLAVAFAQMGIPTLLVDANLRQPRVAQVFGIEFGGDGLVELLTRRSTTASPIHVNVIRNLSVLTAGAIPPNPQELLASPEFLALSENYHSRFGVVLYDTAPGLEYADALVVASRVGTAIIVSRQHRTHWNDAALLSKKLATVKCALVGSVLNTY